ncbi:M20/M25/M40 family metallo-hydrolase [Pseudoxanthomonas sacheonensis]|uniref:Acetylornithine deacetylase/succinyl-diaminopimelate desuccinylase-like protein n=1 Tax=Pseudoxanthomonas sacheonensis TaxID=443615 RepID=A0ABU1RRW6_9GAMM|nr:M20/M25/M40 family metallo-hydrolase [Pseudoxanthomonas sacheonensis]MDR6841528.1 acetylornithine deacetylase/succinyl-diaminopimelate desuccinylase-like protein [Pseudoxanthomonas sacheonensis]
MKALIALAAAALVAFPAAAQVPTGTMGELRPDQKQFFELYKELVETDTTVANGSCTQAAEQIAARLKAAGFADDQVTLFSVPEHPKEGGIVAIYPGTSTTLKPILLLAHIDVVAANRADWERDPFKLIEENGYYYARGIADDKMMAATWADALIRFRQDGYKPARTVKMALTCGEETDTAFNGAQYLANHKRELIDAAFALNEGGGGDTDGKGHLVAQSIQVGEKIYQDYKLVATNPGGHSSQPVRGNAIYAVSDALLKIREHEFPAEFNATTRVFFERAGVARKDAMGTAMAALAKDLGDADAAAVVNTDKGFHSMLRTTCVATMIDGGHAVNALPQRVEANVNCRIFPGHTPAEIKDQLAGIIGNPDISIELARKDKPLAKSPPLDPAIIGPMEALSAKYFPGVPVIPSLSTGATDGLYLSAVGIPTYGAPGMWGDPDGNGVHGLNERLEVRSVYVGRDYLFDLVKALAE